MAPPEPACSLSRYSGRGLACGFRPNVIVGRGGFSRRALRTAAKAAPTRACGFKASPHPDPLPEYREREVRGKTRKDAGRFLIRPNHRNPRLRRAAVVIAAL